MDRELTRAELDELLPLYAIDALDGEEREQVARYVARDAAARAEVEGLREATAYLPHPSREAPAALWHNIENALQVPRDTERDDAPPPAPRLVFSAAPRAQRRRAPWLAIAAAVLLIIATAIGAMLAVRVAHQQDRIDALAAEMHHHSMAHQAAMAMTVPGAHSAMLTSDTGNSAQVVMLPDGSGYFMHSDLAALPLGRTYQLWAEIDNGTATPRYVSVGVLGRAPSVVAFRADHNVTGFTVTEESAGGSTSPGTSMLQGTIS
jgi:hypothetical protein